MVRKRIRYGQNFLKDPDLARSLIQKSPITRDDTVIEIGPGEGILTGPLSQRAGRVIAVEVDRGLAMRLKARFGSGASNVRIVCADFATFEIPGFRCKLFSNIPYNRTADIMRRIFASPRIEEACLIMQKEAAEKYAGIPRESEASVLAKPCRRFEIVHHFHRSDFHPAPAVDSVMMRIVLRKPALVNSAENECYRGFVRHGFRCSKRSLRLAYKKIFTHCQWKRLSRDLDFCRDAAATDLHFEQWLGLFRYFQKGVTEKKARLIHQADVD